LQALRHDKPLQPARIQPHMTHVPDYLLPKKGSGQAHSIGFIPYKRPDKKRKQGGKNKVRFSPKTSKI